MRKAHTSVPYPMVPASEIDGRAITIGPADAAIRIGVTSGTLANMRWAGNGPRFVKVGSRVRYRLSDIAEYLDANTRLSTSESPHA